jgi:hypothetical protein
MGDRWWTKMPYAHGIDVTDVCAGCGHTRDRHVTERKVMGAIRRNCLVKGCDCGPKPFLFHVAGWVGTRDTHTKDDGVKIELNQPAAPRLR